MIFRKYKFNEVHVTENEDENYEIREFRTKNNEEC